MGSNIHCHVEQRAEDGTWHTVWHSSNAAGRGPFDDCTYPTFAFLAGVRNSWNVPVITPLRGMPEDVSVVVQWEYDDWGHGEHHHSWLLVSELTDFDYDSTFPLKHLGSDAPEEPTVYRDFLGENYFTHLRVLNALHRERTSRIVFWFDS